MKITCPKDKETSDKIQCTELKTICPYQYFRMCKGYYVHTEGALRCKIRSNDDNKSRTPEVPKGRT